MGLFSDMFKSSFDKWLESASKSELEDEYEAERIEWMNNGQNGTGQITDKMKRISDEMTKKAAEEWKNDPRRSKDPNYRWTDANRWD